MLLILISWIYVVFSTINFGVLCSNILVLKSKNTVITSFLGLFLITILASIWAIFGRINLEFHIALLIGNGSIVYFYKNEIVQLYQSFWTKIQVLNLGSKVFLIASTILILAKCSTLPFVIDNESYYIQTIKWINEYGFVKGIANLHLYLGQTSGWHITQSVFNFSFLYAKFNDLSGYCLLLGTFFSIDKLHDYYQNHNFNYLLMGVFPLASLYFFQFISAPSPDIPIYVLSFIVLFYFAENFKTCLSENFNLVVVLVLFMLYIKSTALVFALLPVVLLVRNRRLLLKKLLIPGCVVALVLILFIIKNSIVSGSIFFPSKHFASFTLTHSIPKFVESNYYDTVKYFGFQVSALEFKNSSFYELILHWLSMPKINGFLNTLCFSLVFISPAFIYKFQNKKVFWLAYGMMVLQFILLFSTSPQYRFFMNFGLFFGLFCLVSLIRKQHLIQLLLFLSLIPTGYLVFKPVRLETVTNNKFMQSTSTFSFSCFIFPLENSKMKTNFEVIELGNFKYYTPTENDFFFGAGNGPLPCVNKSQIEYFKTKFGVIPQMRSSDLKDGFYAQKVSKDE